LTAPARQQGVAATAWNAARNQPAPIPASRTLDNASIAASILAARRPGGATRP